MSNTLNTEENLVRRAREVFNASVAGLDAGTLARLRAARLKALDAAGHPLPRWQRFGWRVPAAALALAVVAVAAGFLVVDLAPGSSGTSSPFASGNNDDAPVVMTTDNLDMYADMDFYQWMAAQGQAPKQASPEPVDDSSSSDDGDSGLGE